MQVITEPEVISVLEFKLSHFIGYPIDIILMPAGIGFPNTISVLSLALDCSVVPTKL